MSFYQELSRYYDEIFPVDNTEMRFFTKLFSGKKTILDIGCGTGNKTVYFTDVDRRVTGIDADPGMIARAGEEHCVNNMEYRVLDMRGLEQAFAPGSFDGILCLGNTLAHLDGPLDTAQFLTSVQRLLKGRGRFLFQILNYDRILDNEIRTLPALEGPRVTFMRRYRKEGRFLHFLTSITVKETGNIYENDTLLYPLRRKELAELLADVGFEEVHWYGSFDGAPLKDDSFILAACCDVRKDK